jgi:hypothetical protein
MDTYSNYPSDTSGNDSRSAETLRTPGALQGSPGGPGFKPTASDWDEHWSPWQRSQQLWNESGTQWDVPDTAEAQVPQPRSAAGRRSQARYQGRHARSGTLPDQLAAPLAAPLGAPVLTRPAADYDSPAPDKGTGRRVATIVLPTAVVATVAAVAIALLTGSGPRPGHATASKTPHRAESKPQAPRTIGLYSGQQQRGVFQQIDSITGDGDTIVTTG